MCGMSANVSSFRPSAFTFESRDAEQSDDGDAMHERLVAYVHALADGHEPRTGVWVEHSYARARGACATDGAGPERAARDVRVLLAPRAPPPPADAIDVETPEPPLPEPPDAPDAPPDRGDVDAETEHHGCDADDDWEARVAALAPSAAHTRLAEAAFEILRRLRLARLAGRRVAWRQDVRAAARRLRLALAVTWAAPGPVQQRPPAWLHAALHAYLPHELRPLYEEVAAELRRVAPPLADRLLGVRTSLQPSPSSSTEDCGRGVDPEVGPVLLWLRTGRERLERRWERRLSCLMPMRSVDVGAGGGINASPPESWCAGVVATARAAVAEAVVAAGGRGVIIGGVGAGAAVSAAAATGASGVRGALLLAPALLTAEGPRDAPDDPLCEVGVPLLLVVGSGAGNAWRGAARAVAAAGGGLAPRRLVEVRGADHLLRLDGRARRRLALSQRALDAAVAEECARWAAETGDRGGDSEGVEEERPRRRPGTQLADQEEYAHLPAALPSHARAIEIVEGRVVSRVSGGTPLALAPPRRAASSASTPPASLAAADILQLPIVFADDAARPDADVTVTSGEPRRVKYARVIVAKRSVSAASRNATRIVAPRD